MIDNLRILISSYLVLFCLFVCFHSSVGVEKSRRGVERVVYIIYTIQIGITSPDKDGKQKQERHRSDSRQWMKYNRRELSMSTGERRYASPEINRSFVLFATRIQTSLSSYWSCT